MRQGNLAYGHHLFCFRWKKLSILVAFILFGCLDEVSRRGFVRIVELKVVGLKDATGRTPATDWLLLQGGVWYTTLALLTGVWLWPLLLPRFCKAAASKVCPDEIGGCRLKTSWKLATAMFSLVMLILLVLTEPESSLSSSGVTSRFKRIDCLLGSVSCINAFPFDIEVCLLLVTKGRRFVRSRLRSTIRIVTRMVVGKALSGYRAHDIRSFNSKGSRCKRSSKACCTDSMERTAPRRKEFSTDTVFGRMPSSSIIWVVSIPRHLCNSISHCSVLLLSEVSECSVSCIKRTTSTVTFHNLPRTLKSLKTLKWFGNWVVRYLKEISEKCEMKSHWVHVRSKRITLTAQMNLQDSLHVLPLTCRRRWGKLLHAPFQGTHGTVSDALHFP